MKANEFIKKFGMDLAKRDIAALDSGFIKRNDFLEHYGFDILDDLKRLVESHELVEEYNGLFEAKELIRVSPKMTSELRELAAAIADVESCQ